MDAETYCERSIDYVIRRFYGSEIKYYPYTTGTVDAYQQRIKTFGTAVELVGRAILDPTSEEITQIGNNEKWDVAFLFSRLEMVDKFPGVLEGEWVDTRGEMSWDNRRFKIERVHPTAQVKTKFLLVIMLGTTIEGQRDG